MPKNDTFKKTLGMEILQNVHSYLAYVALALLFLAVANAIMGWVGNRIFTMGRDLRLSLFTLIICHIQLLIGLLLYFISASGYNAISQFGIGELTPAARLLALEHPLINIVAIILITIGWSRHKKFMEGNKKFKSIAIFYGLGLLLILSRIPWNQWLN
jgi:uncharacterized membrane protein